VGLRRGAWLFAFLILCAACGPRVPLEALPEIPAVPTADFLPAVRTQLDDARAKLDQDPTDPTHNGRLGMLYLVYKLDHQAETALRRARLLAPRRFEWTYYHAQALLRLGNYDRATAALEAAIARKPGDVAARIQLGVAQRRSGDLGAAQLTLTAVLEDEADQVEARFQLGRVLLRRGEIDDAIVAVEQALEQHGPFADGYFALAEAYRRNSDPARAQQQLGLFERYRGVRLQGGDRLMGRLRQLDRSARSLLHRADQLNRLGRAEEAIELLHQAVAADPGSLTAHSALLWAFGSKRDFAAVDRQFGEASAVNPDDPTLNRNLGRARLLEGRYVEAETALRRALELNPADATGLAMLGQVLEQRGENTQAEAMYRNALEHDPRQMPAHTRLAERLLQRRAHTEAVAHLEAIARYSVGKETAKHWRRLGENYVRLERADAARAAFETGLSRARADGNRQEETRNSRALQRLDKENNQ